MKTNHKSLILTLMLSVLIFPLSLPSSSLAGEIPVVLLPVENSPLVTYRIQFRVGSIDDPDGKKGLAMLTATLLTEGGTQKRSYDEIIEYLYPMAARIQSQVEKEVTTIIATTHRDNLNKVYSLLMEMLLEPGFREEDFERIRTNLINYLAKQLRGNDDENLAKEALNVFMYAGHPYGTPNQGLVSHLEGLTLKDVETHYKKYFTKGTVTVGIAGADTPKLAERALRDLGRLKDGQSKREPLPEPSPINGIEILAVEKECRSTAISIGYPINVTRTDPDFYALLIANSYLGEHRTFNGVLMIRMRQVRGLNYGDYSYIENFIQEGRSTFPLANIPRRQQFFSIWIRPVLHKNRHFSLRLAIWELEKFVKNGLSRDDFEATKKFLINYSKLWAQNQSRRLGYLLDSKFYGTDDFLKTLPEKLQDVTLEQVNAAIKRHLNCQNLRVAVVTKGAEEFLQDLISNKRSPIVYQAEGIPEDVLAEDKKIGVFELSINRDKSRVAAAAELFE
ncbi:MAG: insulinase family protein [Candidatus Latescibacteria bacterium]|nr:insulinase family protein [Candidatus Latescibacterota bacterium]NIO01000.1 insulinase family protein [Candidatus Latescibacterota bacterium]NIO27399.1 insulinase family protein [Candidatus Latescibacterota bacterium]NIO54921.1 insulinase family protein [Candidatus Latescibacterota bacterium]NIT01010.1 insulinase family protein [Candidatus Latescibacterota bacterium]